MSASKHSIYDQILGAGHYIFIPYLKEFTDEDAVYFKDSAGIDRQKIHNEIAIKIKRFYDNEI